MVQSCASTVASTMASRDQYSPEWRSTRIEDPFAFRSGNARAGILDGKAVFGPADLDRLSPTRRRDRPSLVPDRLGQELAGILHREA